jgi:hypothetical protein
MPAVYPAIRPDVALAILAVPITMAPDPAEPDTTWISPAFWIDQL